MVTMFARHKVNDYSSWKRVYDEVAPVRKEKGVVSASVHRDVNAPNTVTIAHQFKILNEAKAFADSEQLKAAMARAGVNGPPEIWFTEDIEHTSN
jgi:quinol monooxygenase YgiN